MGIRPNGDIALEVIAYMYYLYTEAPILKEDGTLSAEKRAARV